MWLTFSMVAQSMEAGTAIVECRRFPINERFIGQSAESLGY
jgi:hypothetical protein